MDRKELLDQLQSLIKLDIDAIHAYDPSDIAAVIRKNLSDEQRHLAFIREALAGGRF